MTPNTLTLLIKPASYLCNLHCHYCFYKCVEDIYSNERLMMTADLAENLIKQAMGSGSKRVIFIWQGGEPTVMGLDFYREIVALQKKYQQVNQVIENTLQTNGILIDDEWCSFFYEENFLVGISLDGPKEIHDRHRTFDNGDGTFDLVMAAIRKMKHHKVFFNILALVTDANIKAATKVYEFFRKNRLDHLQFIPCLEWDRSVERVTDFSIDGQQLGIFYSDLFNLWMDDGFPSVSIRNFEDILIYHFDKIQVSCCWMDRCKSYIVVEHNGDVYPCDFFVKPEWKLGNIEGDTLATCLESPVREKFSSMKGNIPGECKNCTLLNFCNGDCTKFRQVTNSEYTGTSEYCVSLKMLMQEISPNIPRIEKTVYALRSGTSNTENIGRNDPCPCGSGKKYKQCCDRK